MRSRQSQVLPFTLTELLVLLFFVLALALLFEGIRRVRAEERIAENEELVELAERLGSDRAEAWAEIIEQSGRDVPEDFDELVRSVQESSVSREALQGQLVEDGMDSSQVQTMSTEELLDSVVQKAERARREVEILRATAGFGGDAQARIESIVEDLRDVERAQQQLEQEKDDLQNQVTYLQRRVGNGLDHPPCWADSQGRPEYAFEVTLRTGTIDVRPVWPSHRADDARRVPGMLSVPGDNLSLSEFARRAFPVFEWSTQQNPECRHFVRIRDRVEGGKDPFKEALLTVERYFYKLLLD